MLLLVAKVLSAGMPKVEVVSVASVQTVLVGEVSKADPLTSSAPVIALAWLSVLLFCIFTVLANVKPDPVLMVN